jgi:hypothetical protein
MSQFSNLPIQVATHLAIKNAMKSKSGNATSSLLINGMDVCNTDINEEYKEKQIYRQQRLKQLKLYTILKIFGFILSPILVYAIHCIVMVFGFHLKEFATIYLGAFFLSTVEILVGLLIYVVIKFSIDKWKDHVEELKQRIYRESIDINQIKAKKMKEILK